MAERRLTIITFVTFVDFGAEESSAIEGTATAGDSRFDFVLAKGRSETSFVFDQPERGVATRAGQVVELPWPPAGEGVLVAGHPPVEGVGIG
jgi:hypothetical protein